MRITSPRAAALPVACLVGLLGLPAGAAHAADPPLPDLEAVAGRATVAQAPTITTGRYLDHVRPLGDPNIYIVHRTIPGSTIMFGATLLRENGLLKQNRLTLTTAYTDGKGKVVRCGDNAPQEELHTVSTPLATHAGFTSSGAGCATQSDVYLVVRASKAADVAYRTPYELDVWEIPPLTNATKLPEPGTAAGDPVSPRMPTTQVEPGAWPAQAARLTPNTAVHVDLPLGRVAYFAVDVPFNDVLDATAIVSDPSGDSVGSPVEISLMSPVGGLVAVPPAGGGRAATGTIGASPVTVEASTALVNPAARIGTRHDSQGGQTTLSAQPGWYVVAVHVPDDTTSSGSSGATLPMTITAALRPATGAAARGDAPAYAAGLVTFPAPDGPTPTAYTPSSSADSSSDSDHPAAAYGLAGGAAVLVAMGAGVLLISRRGWLS